MDKKLCDYAAQQVPRYTSYPTAPHFKDKIASREYEAWLRELPHDATLSLYLHIPYCSSICHYCGCHTKATRREAPVRAYADTLAQELKLLITSAGSGRPLTHLHWGGGTPSLLPAESFRHLVSVIKQSFVLTSDIEHAIELDPRTVTPELATTLSSIGINRVSLGIQDFNPNVQLAIGRVQPHAQVARAVSILRRAGLNHICFDLMYGLPNQGEAELERSIELAAALRPDRMALFGYAHVPWMKKHQQLIDATALPGTVERFEQAEAATIKLSALGYQRIGLDHFALPTDSLAQAANFGRLRRNFQGYTADPADALLGLGASALSKLPGGFVQNQSDNRAWRREIEAGRLPVFRGKRTDTDDAMRGELIEELMCRFESDLDALSRRYHRNPLELRENLEKLETLRDDGLVEIDGSRIKIPSDRRAFVRLVAAAFDTYLPNGTGRHSAAV